MAIKIDYICPLCNVNHLKDRDISGDFDENGVLLSFCPSCGRMYKVRLSQNHRRTIAVRIAMKCNTDFETTKQITKEAPNKSFIDYISKSLNIIREDILAVIELK